MRTRTVHLRPDAAYWVGVTKTRCGKTLSGLPSKMAQPIVSFQGRAATTDKSLVTCAGCTENNHG